MAVYGIGENKCLKEVLTKDDVYTKDDFIIVNKVINNVPANSQQSVIITASELGVDSVTDLMLISHMVKTGEQSHYRYQYTHENGTLNDGNFIFIDDEGNRVRLYYDNHGSAKDTMTIRLVFMKVA